MSSLWQASGWAAYTVTAICRLLPRSPVLTSCIFAISSNLNLNSYFKVTQLSHRESSQVMRAGFMNLRPNSSWQIPQSSSQVHALFFFPPSLFYIRTVNPSPRTEIMQISTVILWGTRGRTFDWDGEMPPCVGTQPVENKGQQQRLP